MGEISGLNDECVMLVSQENHLFVDGREISGLNDECVMLVSQENQPVCGRERDFLSE